MTKTMRMTKSVAAKEWIARDQELMKALVREALQQILESEMTEQIGAAPGERSLGRLAYRAGYYARNLVTRIGKLELRIPRDREGRFSTGLFERYQRSEKAFVSALAEMCVQGDRVNMNRSGAPSFEAGRYPRQTAS